MNAKTEKQLKSVQRSLEGVIMNLRDYRGSEDPTWDERVLVRALSRLRKVISN